MKKLKLLLTFMFLSAISCGISTFIHSSDNIFNSADAATTTANFGQLYDYLLTKNEHYTYTDQYIRQYQQESGGYIDLWKSQGHVVDKENAEPNQHWHFFESWCKPSVAAGNLKYTASGSRGYSNFSCPELVLWVLEASGVEESKVVEAYNTAVTGKQNGDSVSTICGNIRKVVPWSDINTIVLANLPENPKYHVSPAVDTTSSSALYTMSEIDYDGYYPGDTVAFTVTLNTESKEISSVTGTNVTITENSGIYSFTMPSNHVDVSVTLKDKGGDTPVVTQDGYKLVTSLDELIDGANIIIGTPGSFKRNVAISTTQNANNRSTITMVYDNGYYTVSTDPVQEVSLCVFTISSVNYNEKKYYQFYDAVNNGYLCVKSSSNNYLRTQTTNDVNGYFEITNNSGVMNIVASASSYSRNTIGNYSSTFIGCGGGTSTTTVDLAIYTDVSATTKVWANSYLKMNDSSFDGSGTGLCKSEGLYTNAKSVLLDMGVAYVTTLTTSNDESLSLANTRYQAWAIANNDDDPYGGLVDYSSPLSYAYTISNNNQILIMTIIFASSISIFAIVTLVKYKKKTNK